MGEQTQKVLKDSDKTIADLLEELFKEIEEYDRLERDGLQAKTERRAANGNT